MSVTVYAQANTPNIIVRMYQYICPGKDLGDDESQESQVAVRGGRLVADDLCVCVCARARARVRACVRACMRACMHA